MHVLLAGATGVIGRRVTSLLVERGIRVTATTRRPPRAGDLRSLGAEPLVVDAHDRAAMRAAVLAARPDVVMHQLTDLSAGDTSANANLRIHGTRNLVDAALEAGVTRIVAQSVAWAYAPGDEPAEESEPLDHDAPEPRRTTVAGVAALETAVAELPESVVLRYGQLYGPGTWFARDGSRADEARASRLVADDDISSFVHVEDAASAAVAALDWPVGAFNVCDDEPAAARRWVPAFCAAVGAPPPPARHRPRTAWSRGASNRHVRLVAGWTPSRPSWRTDSFDIAGPDR
jgi:nucleoside-diphosphate-sugar epimerase